MMKSSIGKSFILLLGFMLFLACETPNHPHRAAQQSGKELEISNKDKLNSSQDTIGLIGKQICRNPIGPGDEGYFELKLLMNNLLEAKGEAGNWTLSSGNWEVVLDTLKIQLNFQQKDSSNNINEIHFKLLKQDLRYSQSDCLQLHVPLNKLY